MFNFRISFLVIGLILSLAVFNVAYARDVAFDGQEMMIYVSANEPTQLKFPGEIVGGFIRKDSLLSLKRVGTDLILFARTELPSEGESIIVRLKDGRSFSVRVVEATQKNTRDNFVRIEDLTETGADYVNDKEGAPYARDKYNVAPPTKVSGFMREMVLASEFGKNGVPGYRLSDHHRGETVFNDSTMVATVDRIFIGPQFWGYVLDTENLLDESQIINPGSFRLDGTRAISASQWELAPRPLNTEQQIAGKHKTKLYIITKAR
jgi:hypothetical protein